MDEKKKYEYKPYESKYKPQLDDLYSKLQNRKPFEYNLNGDALYQMYKNEAIAGGRLAMQDTMANAQQMTGGYGNSNAINVGQQAYQASMLGLAGKIPQLAQTAYEMYEREGDKLKGQIGMLEGLEGSAYDRYLDERNMALQDEDRAKRDEAAAYDKLLMLIKMGYKPGSDEIAGAGLTKPQFDAIWNKYHPAASGGGGGGYGGGYRGGSRGGGAANGETGSGGPMTYEEEYKALLDAGATSQEINDFQTSSLNEHRVSHGEAHRVHDKYKK